MQSPTYPGIGIASTFRPTRAPDSDHNLYGLTISVLHVPRFLHSKARTRVFVITSNIGMIVSILWNAVTSPETFLNENSVKMKLYKTPSSILHCIGWLGDNNGGQGYWVSQIIVSRETIPPQDSGAERIATAFQHQIAEGNTYIYLSV